MSEISNWVFGILGVVILGVMVDLILPNGKLNGFIRAIFGFITLIVIISPLPKLFNKEFNIQEVFYNETTTQIDYDYLVVMTDKMINTIEKDLQKKLEKAGFCNVNVEIDYILENYAYKIKKVVLNLKNLVINGSVSHINKYTEMVQVVTNNINVEEEDVIFNE